MLNESSQQPLSRFKGVLRLLAATPYADAKEWTRWVRRWRFASSSEDCPVTLASTGLVVQNEKLGDSSAVLAKSFDQTIISFIKRLLGGEIDDSEISIGWKRFREQYIYEPHINPYYQTCIVERPHLITPYTFDGTDPPLKMLDMVETVNVATGEERNFIYSIDEAWRLTLTFDVGENRRVFWKLDRQKARGFLRAWAKQGKGIVVSSNAYDFSNGDIAESRILYDLPHAVVAVSDLRSVWNRIALSGPRGLNGSRIISAAVIPAPEAPDRYAFLVLKSEHNFPIVVIPCLMQTALRALGIVEEMYTPPEFSMTAASAEEVQSWATQSGSSFRAAFQELDGFFCR